MISQLIEDHKFGILFSISCVVVIACTIFLAAEKFTQVAPIYKKFESISSSAHGRITKDFYDNTYNYYFVYNLPITNPPFQLVNLGKNFNDKYTREHYQLYLGTTAKQMENVGQLVRFSDGFHKLRVKSDKDYKYGCVTLGGKSVNCFKLI